MNDRRIDYRRVARRTVSIRGRRVHLRHAGRGPRVLLIHGSPASSAYFLPLLTDLVDDYCCIAPDTPGFGDSAPLPAGATGISDLARATGELIEALACGPCIVLGSHTGAGIALELALQRPELVAGLILDGVALFDAAEQQTLFAGCFETLHIDERGGHYARTWTRIRDMFIWFPWTRHDPARLNGTDLPPPERAHRWVSMFFQGAPNYPGIYRAAIGYSTQGLATIARQTRPALYMAHERDMLAPHLQRLPVLKPTDRIELTAAEPGHWLAAVRRELAALVQRESVASGALPPPAEIDDDQFIELAHGQLRLRRFGAPQLPPLLLLHDAPASGASLADLAQQLAVSHCVWLPDLPGCGQSEALPTAAPLLADYVQALQPLLMRGAPAASPLRWAVYGRGCGAVVALALALAQPERINRLLLDELPLPGPGVTLPDRRICAPIQIQPDGAHWFRLWQMLRDSQIFWPWYETSAAHLLRLPGNFDSEFLHDWVLEVMQQPATAHCLPQAAYIADAKALLSELRAPVWLLARRGHPLAGSAAAAANSAQQRRAVVFEADERVNEVRRLLAE